MSIIKHVTLQRTVAHDFRYDPRNVEISGTALQAANNKIIRRMRIACWTPKATDTTHSHCIKPIAFPLQIWLRERASMLPL